MNITSTKGSSSNSNNRGPNPNLKCTNCNKIGHTMDKCFEIVGYPAWYVKRTFNSNSRSVTSNNATVDPNSNNSSSSTTSNSPVSLSNEQLTRLMNLLNDNGVSSANANMSDFFVGNISLGWIVDSGANQHMTVSAKFLVDVVDISNLGLTVGHPNEYTVSLQSVHKLSRDNKLFVGFDETCKIVSNNYISSCNVSKSLWHQRLGHPSDQVLDVLKSTLNLDSQTATDHLCDICNKAKQTREPFSLSDHKSSKIGLSGFIC
ncbi:ribonuclease H-like domain-containing protein [Tanacetum coccineum]